MRLVVVPVSTWGSFSPAALRFFADLAQRVGGQIPHALLDRATWAAPTFAPFLRMVLGHAARRGLATSVCTHWRRVHDVDDIYAVPDPPASPSLSSIDEFPPLPALAAPAPVGPMPGPAIPAGAVPGPPGHIAAGLFGPFAAMVVD